jgi:hypothetical protein
MADTFLALSALYGEHPDSREHRREFCPDVPRTMLHVTMLEGYRVSDTFGISPKLRGCLPASSPQIDCSDRSSGDEWRLINPQDAGHLQARVNPIVDDSHPLNMSPNVKWTDVASECCMTEWPQHRQR